MEMPAAWNFQEARDFHTTTVRLRGDGELAGERHFHPDNGSYVYAAHKNN